MKNKILAAFAAALMATGISLTAASPALAVEEPLALPSPTFIDECGTINDRIEVPEIDGVFYGVYDYTGSTKTGWLADEANNYGFVEGQDANLVIATQDNWRPFEQAIAPEGDYELDSAGSPGWWFPAFTDEPCAPESVYLPSPVQNDGCGVETDPYAAFDLPTVEGVYYGIYNYSGTTTKPSWDEYGWEPGDAWLIIAGPDDWGQFETPPTVDDGVYVDSYGNAGWWFPAFSNELCEVTPERPKWSDPAGAGNATWIFTDQPSHHYVISYPPNGRIRVTAVANEGYVFAEGAQTVWGRAELNK